MRRTAQPISGDVQLLGKSTGTAGSVTLYARAKVGGTEEVAPGDGVVLRGRSAEEESQGPLLGLVQAMWKDAKGVCVGAGWGVPGGSCCVMGLQHTRWCA